MASTFTARLRYEKQADGENSNTWGSKANVVFDLIDEARAGYLSKSVAGASDVTLTANNSATDENRQAVLEFTGAITASISVIVSTVENWWLIKNSTTGAFTLTVKTSAGSGIVVTQGEWAVLYCDGTDVLQSLIGENLVNDTTPQLGGDLDANTFDIQFDDATGIRDDSDNEQLIFQKTTTAINHFEMTNAAAAGDPSLAAVGGDTDVGINLVPKGTGGVIHPAGAVGTPSVGFSGDPDTGMYSPGANQLALVTQGAEAINIDANGIVTQPLQSSFLATNSATDTNVTGNGATVTVEFDNEVFDQNADFNNTTDTFTAPVTGRYIISAIVRVDGLASASRFDMSIVTSNRQYRIVSATPPDDRNSECISAVADMDANDTATVTVIVQGMAGDTADIIGDSNATTYFSGALIA